jgi:hypothetical protein
MPCFKDRIASISSKIFPNKFTIWRRSLDQIAELYTVKIPSTVDTSYYALVILLEEPGHPDGFARMVSRLPNYDGYIHHSIISDEQQFVDAVDFMSKIVDLQPSHIITFPRITSDLYKHPGAVTWVLLCNSNPYRFKTEKEYLDLLYPAISEVDVKDENKKTNTDTTDFTIIVEMMEPTLNLDFPLEISM